jgi:hypothetical protein
MAADWTREDEADLADGPTADVAALREKVDDLLRRPDAHTEPKLPWNREIRLDWLLLFFEEIVDTVARLDRDDGAWRRPLRRRHPGWPTWVWSRLSSWVKRGLSASNGPAGTAVSNSGGSRRMARCRSACGPSGLL